MQLHGVDILDEFAEGFRMWAARLLITADDDRWLGHAVSQVAGYGTSVIGCDAEVGVESYLAPADTPDGRPGAAVMFFAFSAKALDKALPNRVGQCLMTCPTTAVYDGMPLVQAGEDSARVPLGSRLRYFGDGFQKSKLVNDEHGRPRRYWRVPVMDGEFVVEESVGVIKAVGGGNFLICGRSRRAALDAATAAVDAITTCPNVITPFPGGVVRSGSKVGSRYKALFASTNDAWCPTLRNIAADSKVPPGVQAVYEIVIDGATREAVADAMRCGIEAACRPPEATRPHAGERPAELPAVVAEKLPGAGVVAISAGNYGGNLGKFHFHLHDVMRPQDASP